MGRNRKIYLCLLFFFVVTIFSSYYYENNAKKQVFFVCPENYTDSNKYDTDLYSFALSYLKNNPNATAGDATTYRYYLLVSNKCQKTLDYIRTSNVMKNGTSSKVSDLEFFKEETLSAMGR